MKTYSRGCWAVALALVLLSCGKAAGGGSTNVLGVCDEPSLRAAIAAGGWISVTCNGTVTLANSLSISNTVILDATGVSFGISGSNAVRILYVAPGTEFSATNLTLANGSSIIVTNSMGTNADGGAIYNDGSVTLVNCTLTNNSALCPIFGGFAGGGAIFNNGGRVTLSQSVIAASMVLGGGTNSKSQDPNEVITLTGTGLGGAIFNEGGNVILSGCVITGNICQSVVEHDYMNFGTGLAMGGAVFQSSGSLLISNSSFIANQAVGGPSGQPEQTAASPAYGGAVAVNGGSLAVDGSCFLVNKAVGGVVAYGVNEYGGSGGVAYGGAIYCNAGWTCFDSSFYGNQALAGFGDFMAASGCGGGIYNAGALNLERCSVCSNFCQGGAGQTYNSGESSYGGNALGAGIFNTGQIGATNCTIALNFASAGIGSGYFEAGSSIGTDGNAIGGGVFNNTDATFIAMNLTIASNSCSSSSGDEVTNGLAAGVQIANTNGTAELHNSIIAYGGTNGNAYGVITDDGYNISSDDTAGFSGSGSLNNTDPKLGPLADFGGPTWCMALRYDSPAIDAGDSAGAPPTDQRGAVRPNGSGVDIGAYEFYSNQIDVPVLSLTPVTNTLVLRFPAYPLGLYHLLTSSNLITWTDSETFGPFDGPTNVSQIVNNQNGSVGFYRLLLP
jgi:hypothetical protein